MTRPFDPGQFVIEWLTADAGIFFRRGATLESTCTAHQQLEVIDTPALGRMFRLDGCNMTSEADEFFYHENIVHPGALAQDAPARALVVGGGDGGAIEELLKHPTITRVVMAELDPEVVRIAREHLPSVHRGALDDPRVEIRIGDALDYVHATDERFDIVIMDLTDPEGPAAALYTVGFYQALRRILQPAGTLSLHLGSPFFHRERFVEGMKRLREVYAIVRPYCVHIPLYGASWGMACVSQQTDPLALDPEAIDARIAARAIRDLAYYNGDVHRAGFALPNYVRALLQQASRST